MRGPDVNAHDTQSVVTTHPLPAAARVLLGALIATCTVRLMSVRLADICGALHLGFDEGSWINTSFNASMMFIGPSSVYLGDLLIATCCVACLLVVSFMSKVSIQYRQVTAAPVEVK